MIFQNLDRQTVTFIRLEIFMFRKIVIPYHQVKETVLQKRDTFILLLDCALHGIFQCTDHLM